jgi:phenylacetate-CoA ligase
MYEQIFRKVLFPLFEGPIKGRNTHRYLEEYEASQWLAPADLEQLQLRKLNALLDHCWRNVPFLGRHWRGAGLRPGALAALRDFQDYPVLEKKHIKENYDDMRARAGVSGPVHSKTTGGSTGDPFRFEYTEEVYARRTAVMWRGYRWCDTDVGRRTVYVWGTGGALPGMAGLKERLYTRAFNRLLLNSFSMSESTLPDYARALNDFKPKVVVGYVAPLRMLARWSLDNGFALHRPMSVLTGAEALMRPDRELIAQAFGAPVYNTYGCREVMLLACECQEQRGLHASADHLLLESVDAAGRQVRAGSGAVCVTDFHNFAMPFVRYLNGDRATFADRSCPCGRGLPLLESVDGRILDVILGVDGSIVPGEYLVYVMLGFPQVTQWQVVQHTLDTLDVLIVAPQPLTAAQKNEIIAKIADKIGPRTRIQIHEVDDIPLTASGKRRVTVSHIGGAGLRAPEA